MGEIKRDTALLHISLGPRAIKLRVTDFDKHGFILSTFQLASATRLDSQYHPLQAILRTFYRVRCFYDQ